jgi:hypothetical protein
MATLHTEPKVYPAIAHLKTLFTALAVWFYGVDVIQVLTFLLLHIFSSQLA